MKTKQALGEDLAALARVIKNLRRRVARAKARNRALQELLRQAQTDPVTGLLFERAALDRVWRQVQRIHKKQHGAMVVVIFMDANGLREINQTYGHTVGDQYLKAHAKRLSAITRPCDVVMRRGRSSDEFIALLVLSEEEYTAMVASGRIEGMLAQLRGGTMRSRSGGCVREIDMNPHMKTACANISQGSTREEAEKCIGEATKKADPKGKP